MNDCSSCKIYCSFSSKMKKETIGTPNPMTNRIIYQQTPDGNKEAIGFKVNPFSKRSGNKRRSNNCELALEHGENIFRNTCIHDISVNAFQKEIVRIPSKPATQNIFPETHAVTHNNP